MTSGERAMDAAVEAVARAISKRLRGVDVAWPEDERTARAAVEALLGARVPLPCETCGGTRQIEESWDVGMCACPDCYDSDDGTRDGGLLVLQLLGAEQVGWLGPYGIIPGGMDNDPASHWQPVFRLPAASRED